MTRRELLALASERLGSREEAVWLLEGASGKNLAELVLSLGEEAPSEEADLVSRMLQRRQSGEPLQYVLGTWGFRGLDLKVDARALIPRPETEVLVDIALAELGRFAAATAEPRCRVADLGTGSGAIALAIASEAAELLDEVWATDSSGSALELARMNSSRLADVEPHAAAKLRLARGSWYEALPRRLVGELGVIASNPPYVAASEMARLPVEVVEWEPAAALLAGPAGIEAIREVLLGAPRWLAPGGSVVVEIGAGQAGAAVEISHEAGFCCSSVRRDLAGLPRVLVACLK